MTDWSIFNPEEPEAVVDRLGKTRSVGILLRSPSPWALGSALSIAREFARRGRRVLLCDGMVQQPALNGVAAGLPDEGLSDVVLYGASLDRVRYELDDGLQLIGLGTPVVDVSKFYSADAWQEVLDADPDPACVVLVLLPGDEPALNPLVERLQTVVRVARSPDLSAADPLAARVALRLRRAPRSGSRRASGSRRRSRTRPGGGRRGWALGLLAVAVALVVLGWGVRAGRLDVPGVEAEQLPAFLRPPTATPLRPAADEAAPVIITAGVQPLNLVADVVDGPDAARVRAVELETRLPQLTVAVSPVVADSGVAWRLLVGPFGDSLAAEALFSLVGDRLDDSSLQSEPALVDAPFSFPIDDLEDYDAARDVRDLLRAAGLPGHVLELERSDGSMLYRVYAGAFANRAEADFLRELLAQRGVAHGPLSRRVGRTVQPPGT